MAGWDGVTVSGNRVAQLDLKSKGMTGSIPSALGQLKGLTLLYLYENELTGSIPSELGGLMSLEWLSLRSNGLTGSIPSALGQLANLKGLLLQNNGLSGSIPSELVGLKKLSSLYLDGNELSGSIPAELGQLTRLRTLSLSGNGLSGCIPHALQGQASGINPQQGSVNLPVCVNDKPTFSSAATVSVAENTAAVGTVAATDADDDDSIAGYAITGGADRALFAIDTNTGALTFASAPNYEDPKDVASTTPASAAGDNEYIVVVRATGGTGSRALTATQTIAVTVTDVDGEAPSAPSAPKVSAITSTGFTLTWAAPANAGPAITDYAVQYRADGGAWTDAGHSGTEADRGGDGAEVPHRLRGAGAGDQRRGRERVVVFERHGHDSGAERGAGLRQRRDLLGGGERGRGGHGDGDGRRRQRQHRRLRDHRRRGPGAVRHHQRGRPELHERAGLRSSGRCRHRQRICRGGDGDGRDERACADGGADAHGDGDGRGPAKPRRPRRRR